MPDIFKSIGLFLLLLLLPCTVNIVSNLLLVLLYYFYVMFYSRLFNFFFYFFNILILWLHFYCLIYLVFTLYYSFFPFLLLISTTFLWPSDICLDISIYVARASTFLVFRCLHLLIAISTALFFLIICICVILNMCIFNLFTFGAKLMESTILIFREYVFSEGRLSFIHILLWIIPFACCFYNMNIRNCLTDSWKEKLSS